MDSDIEEYKNYFSALVIGCFNQWIFIKNISK